MRASDYNRTDVSSSSRRLCEAIKENGGIEEATTYLCPLDYSILCRLLKRYKEKYPEMAFDTCEQTEEYCKPEDYVFLMYDDSGEKQELGRMKPNVNIEVIKHNAELFREHAEKKGYNFDVYQGSNKLYL